MFGPDVAIPDRWLCGVLHCNCAGRDHRVLQEVPQARSVQHSEYQPPERGQEHLRQLAPQLAHRDDLADCEPKLDRRHQPERRERWHPGAAQRPVEPRPRPVFAVAEQRHRASSAVHAAGRALRGGTWRGCVREGLQGRVDAKGRREDLRCGEGAEGECQREDAGGL
uniref:(northern house mosquito) hypothetical protein n=1 Tax=Culex pipiens TaxID=7175 RepID=A0A8D8GGJ2_CULPI